MEVDMRGIGGPKGPPKPKTNTVVQLGTLSVAQHDLEKSGLHVQDMKVRGIGGAELAACSAVFSQGQMPEGYVIPYFDPKGALLAYYRMKLENHDPKYVQPKKSQNHIYFPPNFARCLTNAVKEGVHVLMIVEGEKKAAAAVKAGIPCVGIGGVDSWRSRTLVLPGKTELTQVTKNTTDGKKIQRLRARLPASGSSISEELMTLAVGFDDMLEVAMTHSMTFLICFDSDIGGKVKHDVQRAAAMLAYEIRFLGVPAQKVKQLVLPDLGLPTGKSAVDDYLVKKGAEAFKQITLKAANDPRAFPRHPNPKAFINKVLENHPKRREAMQIGMAVLTDLDGRGRRLRDKNSGEPYYYSDETHKLLPAVFGIERGMPDLHATEFGRLIYRDFGLSANDDKVLSWLASQFTGEEPIQSVVPKRLLSLTPEDHHNPDGLAVQISDSEYISVSSSQKNPIRLCDNGTNNILFEQGQVIPLDSHLVVKYFHEQNAVKKFDPWWAEVMKSFNFRNKREIAYATLLMYISPWLQRWKGLQLPIELVIGEAGSGKSSMFMLRLNVLQGHAQLRNMPSDVKDWYAGLRNVGGLHVTDNVKFVDRQLQQRLSDEMCRLVTEPNPHVEMRKYFTNTDQINYPVQAIFGMTAIQQPFHNSDLIQRSAIFLLEPREGTPDGDWVTKTLDHYGGREAWIAHHLVFLHRWLRIANTVWSGEFNTVHRLAHYEQSLAIAGQVVGMDTSWLRTTLRDTLESALSEADWTYEGLKHFVYQYVQMFGSKGEFPASQIAEWAQGEEDFKENKQLTSSFRLGKYLGSHKHQLTKILGLQHHRTVANKQMFRITEAGAANAKTWFKPVPPKKSELDGYSKKED